MTAPRSWPGRDAAADDVLPTVIATSVIRSTHQGESHGGVFLVDLATGGHEQILDWNDGSIDWSGRGGDRGLRGIAFHDGRVFLAASDEIFVYDDRLGLLDSIRSPYLRHCHEITVSRGRLFATSTGFDSILVFDLERWAFSDGLCLRELRLPSFRRAYYQGLKHLARGLGRHDPRAWRLLSAHLRVRRFDPLAPGGPEPLDLFHVNNVDVAADGLCFCGTQIDGLFRLHGDRVQRVAWVPAGTHNTRIVDGALIYNDTEAERVVVRRPGGGEAHRLPGYEQGALEHAELGRDHARMGFGRGLCVLGPGLLAAGSSPATISVFRRGSEVPITTVNLTMDVRNAVHGLEVWPFDRRLADWRARTRGPSRAPARVQDLVEATAPLPAS